MHFMLGLVVLVCYDWRVHASFVFVCVYYRLVILGVVGFVIFCFNVVVIVIIRYLSLAVGI